ncbi:MAG: lysine--tRNA ligase [Sulfuricaulis sp.]|uniref:lysine--tRNA ligase n=1 Tax=Sulfuricaulis sp. TaxID=2003553 RepID=UPI0034A5BAB0
MSEEQDENEHLAQRRHKLADLRNRGNAFPNDFRRNALADELLTAYGAMDPAEIETRKVHVKVAGRMMTRRIMGKASFAHIQDMSNQIQAYVTRDAVGEGHYEEFKRWDIGDIIGVTGFLFKTKTGELSIKTEEMRLLTKSLRPLPEKYHGLTDTETKYRQRYLDLIMSASTRKTFQTRTAMVRYIRRFFDDKGFLEVESPMMQIIPGGAAARPFVTHHHALDMNLYLRVAPELYLKRLIVGGIEKVYEINRSFRNEGLSTRHNPEFTMLEFYQAYADYRDLMNLTEEMLRGLAREITGTETITFQGEKYDFGERFRRMTFNEAIMKHNSDINEENIGTLDALQKIAMRLEIPVKQAYGTGKLLLEIFEKTVESQLKIPTYITSFPTEVSPLARRNDDDPTVADRFELFVGGREIANGFSELNDPEDQAERFRIQVAEKNAGNEEAMHYDEEYIRALEYGMPPTAGEGIGIDRLVMLFTDSPSIRDVLLFPHMRPER